MTAQAATATSPLVFGGEQRLASSASPELDRTATRTVTNSVTNNKDTASAATAPL